MEVELTKIFREFFLDSVESGIIFVRIVKTAWKAVTLNSQSINPSRFFHSGLSTKHNC